MFQPYDERALVLREPRAETPVTDFLRAARARISAPEHWCQFQLRRDIDGVRQECSVGAMQGLTEETNGDWYRMGGKLERWFGSLMDVVEINNSRTHPEVMAMWDRAISMAERAGA